MSSENSTGDPRVLAYLDTQVLIHENRLQVTETLQWPIGVLSGFLVYEKFGVLTAIIFGSLCFYLCSIHEKRKLKQAETKLANYKAQFPDLIDESYQ